MSPKAGAGAGEASRGAPRPLSPGPPPKWIMLMPAGELNARDGRRWRLDDATAVVAETRRRAGGADLVFDYNHQTEHVEKNGQPAPASGWIKALEVRAGAIWGRVEWTARAAKAITAREFRYVSPVFSHTRAGKVLSLVRAALLNDPALDMPALASHRAIGGDATLTAEERAVCAQLGISGDAFLEAKAADLAGLNSAAADTLLFSRGAGATLTAKERAVCAQLGISSDAFRVSRAADMINQMGVPDTDLIYNQIEALQTRMRDAATDEERGRLRVVLQRLEDILRRSERQESVDATEKAIRDVEQALREVM